MKNVLKISEPIIKGYPDYGYQLTVVQNDPELDNWIYCNYIQLYYNPKDEENLVRYYYADVNGRTWNTRNPTLEYQTIHKDVLQTLNIGIIDFLIKMIDLGYYCYLYIDEYYLPHSPAYNQFHIYHVNFIYGYDTDEKKLYLAGYDKTFLYSYNTVDFDIFETSYNLCPREEYEDRNTIYLYYICPTKQSYQFDIATMLEQIKEYLYCKNSQRRFDTCFNVVPWYSFGLDCLSKVKEYLDEQIDSSDIKFNNKPYFIFWEHKNLMISRIDFLIKRGYLKEDCQSKVLFEELKQFYLKILNMAIKYEYRQDIKILKRLKENIEIAEVKEPKCWKILIDEVESIL